MEGNLQGRAEGSTVQVLVDMDRRTLAFAINTGPLIDAGVQLPAGDKGVRAWVRLGNKGDAVRLE